MQSLGEIERRVPAVGAKIGVFLYVTLGLPARGGHSSNKYCDGLWVDFDAVFGAFFRMD